MKVNHSILIIIFVIHVVLGDQSPEWQTPIMTKNLVMTKSQYLSLDSRGTGVVVSTWDSHMGDPGSIPTSVAIWHLS